MNKNQITSNCNIVTSSISEISGYVKLLERDHLTDQEERYLIDLIKTAGLSLSMIRVGLMD